MLTYIFFAFENIFYGIVFDLEIAGKIRKLYIPSPASLLRNAPEQVLPRYDQRQTLMIEFRPLQHECVYIISNGLNNEYSPKKLTSPSLLAVKISGFNKFTAGPLCPEHAGLGWAGLGWLLLINEE